MKVMPDFYYTKEHEWAVSEQNTIVIGITDYAQQELGDVVFVDLPALSARLSKGESFMTVESVKAVSDIYAPLDGEIVAVNEQLKDAPELVNKEPFSGGWLVKVKPDDPAQLQSLLAASDYEVYINEICK